MDDLIKRMAVTHDISEEEARELADETMYAYENICEAVREVISRIRDFLKEFGNTIVETHEIMEQQRNERHVFPLPPLKLDLTVPSQIPRMRPIFHARSQL